MGGLGMVIVQWDDIQPLKKKWSPIIHESIEGTPDHYVKWNTQGMERQEPYDLTQVESKERKKWSHLIEVEGTMVVIKGWRYREWEEVD